MNICAYNLNIMEKIYGIKKIIRILSNTTFCNCYGLIWICNVVKDIENIMDFLIF